MNHLEVPPPAVPALIYDDEEVREEEEEELGEGIQMWLYQRGPWEENPWHVYAHTGHHELELIDIICDDMARSNSNPWSVVHHHRHAANAGAAPREMFLLANLPVRQPYPIKAAQGYNRCASSSDDVTCHNLSLLRGTQFLNSCVVDSMNRLMNLAQIGLRRGVYHYDTTLLPSLTMLLGDQSSLAAATAQLMACPPKRIYGRLRRLFDGPESDNLQAFNILDSGRVRFIEVPFFGGGNPHQWMTLVAIWGGQSGVVVVMDAIEGRVDESDKVMRYANILIAFLVCVESLMKGGGRTYN
jgi:hypothetical protein